MPATWTCPETTKVFQTGASPSSRHALLSAPSFMPTAAPPEHVAYVPKYRSMYGNDRYGDCVTAEEAFAKSCYHPEIVIPDEIVISYCRSHGTLNGASLDEVLDSMYAKGFQVSSQLYNDGQKSGVDFSNETILQAAIAQGPVKIAIAAGALPGGAGSRDGWYSMNSRNRYTDHAVALCGYGTADWLYQQLNTPLPSGLPATTPGYLLYTWSTIGFVSHNWVMGTTDEAWVRNPTTVGVPPLAPPVPPTPPTINGTIYGKQVNGVTVINGEIELGGNAYIAVPIGGGFYKFIPKVNL